MSMPPLVRRGLSSNGRSRRIILPTEPPLPQRRSKYGNQQAIGLYGELYDSKAERLYAFTLEQRRKAHLIDRWSWAPRFALQQDPLITFRPDFVVWAVDGSMRVVDVKGGVDSRDFSVRVRLWKHIHPDVPLIVVRNGQEVTA